MMNHDMELLREDTTSFSTSARAHGLPCVNSCRHQLESHSHFTSSHLWRPTRSHCNTVYPDAQVERMRHLHRGALAIQAPGYFETLPRPRAGCPREPRSVGKR
jgi:hypothetical protein